VALTTRARWQLHTRRASPPDSLSHPRISSHTRLHPITPALHPPYTRGIPSYLLASSSPYQANRSELEALKTERKSVLEREKDAHELANYLVSLQVMEQEQSGLEALAEGWRPR
jgi:hypothetical protein